MIKFIKSCFAVRRKRKAIDKWKKEHAEEKECRNKHRRFREFISQL